MKYRSNGEDAVMGAKGKRSYDWGTKVAAARDHVDNDMTKTEVMAKYAIASVAPLERWCRECLCSMVLRPVERLVFSPKER